MNVAKNILIVDDEENIRWLFTEALGESPYNVHTASSAEEALEKLDTNPYMMVFTDIFMEGMSGMDLLKRINAQKNSPHVVVMTAQDTMNNTIEAMREGAFDYISKPFNIDQIFELIGKVEKTSDIPPPMEEVPIPIEDFSLESIIGKNKKMQDIFKIIGKAAATPFPVLITGESGTGKELVARALHYFSDRSQDPFIFINCAAISRELLESELFGHEKGAFTGAIESKKGKFELAHNGTIMLDEIGDMELPLQAKILRVLQNNEFYRVGGKDSIRVDVRVIAATNQDLMKRMGENRFREDLYHRLNVINIHMPPLRNRLDDVLVLANYFLNKHKSESTEAVYLSPQVEDLFKHYSWPGNIRELENVIKRSLVLVARGPILPEHLPDTLLHHVPQSASQEDSWNEGLSGLVREFLDQHAEEAEGDLHNRLIESVEQHLFEQMLQTHRGNQVATAKSLGINRNTLKRKIDAMGIEPKKKKSENKN